MKICFPVQKDEGISSTVYNHFGSAPIFVVVDTNTDAVASINNGDQAHAHGQCNPIKALNDKKIDAVVVGGIGAGALSKLNQMGIKVHRAQAGTVEANVRLFKTQTLPELKLQECCGGHSKSGECGH